jgi:hypothetical protein
MHLRSGERICIRTVDDEGIPIVRYGTVASDNRTNGPVAVLFDDLSGGDLVDASEVERIDYDTIELHLQGEDLMHDNVLRAGLTTMWRAEANLAGLTVDAMFPLGDNDAGIADGDTWILAEFNISGTTHIVRATRSASSPTTVIVRADRANRWDGFF